MSCTTPPPSNLPAVPTDRARFYVACFKLARALDVQIDQSTPDHEIVEALAERVTPALAGAFLAGWKERSDDEGCGYAAVRGGTTNPYDGSPL